MDHQTYVDLHQAGEGDLQACLVPVVNLNLHKSQRDWIILMAQETISHLEVPLLPPFLQMWKNMLGLNVQAPKAPYQTHVKSKNHSLMKLSLTSGLLPHPLLTPLQVRRLFLTVKVSRHRHRQEKGSVTKVQSTLLSPLAPAQVSAG